MTVTEEEMHGAGAGTTFLAGAAIKPDSSSPAANPNDTRTDFPATKFIHELIEEQVHHTPNAIAVIFEGEQLTYGELNARAEELAAQLQGLGVGPDVPVGLCIERSLEMIVGLFGILKAGGCYVPLDPAYPKERLALMIADSKPPVLVTQTSLRDNLGFETQNLKLLCMDQSAERSLTREHIRATQNTAPTSANLAYVIYTSGSTGKPKGVMITHRNVVNFFTGMDRVLGTKSGVWLAVTSISFDISVLELFWTLARGFTVVIRPEESRALNASIPDQVIRHGVTHLQCTPSLAGNFINAPTASVALRQLSKLLIGGEALPTSLAAQLRQMLRGDLLNMYGPTETTVWSATHKVEELTGSIPIGRPIANTQIYILDEHLRPVVNGEAGEIFIGGEGVVRGYFNRPELTLEKFIPDPFNSDVGRLYRTGDVGRHRADGSIEFLGRVDNQIKVNGHRIELGEIESILRQHSAVRECVVHTWEPDPGDKRLAAYLIPVGSSVTSVGELRRFLEPKLPRHMIPAAFVWIEKMPLTPNGKIDRKALPKPGEIRPPLDTAYTAPQNQIEETIANIWREILRVERIGTHDNFFDLGGSSLLLLETHARLRSALKVDLSVVRLFEHPNIAALAEFLNKQSPTSAINVSDRATRQRAAFAGRKLQALNV